MVRDDGPSENENEVLFESGPYEICALDVETAAAIVRQSPSRRRRLTAG